MVERIPKTVAVIVAHPDDETLWTGGTILDHHSWNCFIISLCRKNDTDRAPKFFKALKFLNADGKIGDLDDGPDQVPLPDKEVENAILDLLPQHDFDLIITHHLKGEYTRHRRHEEIGKAVINLWNKNRITTKKLWIFAYEDGGRKYYPKPIPTASAFHKLSSETWQQKYKIITDIYGFPKTGWEAQTTPKSEAFWEMCKP